MCSWPFPAPLPPPSSPPISVKPTAERDASASNRCTSRRQRQGKGSVWNELMVFDAAVKVHWQQIQPRLRCLNARMLVDQGFPATAWRIRSPGANSPGDLVGLAVPACPGEFIACAFAVRIYQLAAQKKGCLFPPRKILHPNSYKLIQSTCSVSVCLSGQVFKISFTEIRSWNRFLRSAVMNSVCFLCPTISAQLLSDSEHLAVLREALSQPRPWLSSLEFASLC